MILETFFEKFDTIADAPNAVTKMRFFSANGANHPSLGHRPRNNFPIITQALKGRTMDSRAGIVAGWIALSGLDSFLNVIPRAMPWAGMKRPVRAGEIAS